MLFFSDVIKLESPIFVFFTTRFSPTGPWNYFDRVTKRFVFTLFLRQLNFAKPFSDLSGKFTPRKFNFAKLSLITNHFPQTRTDMNIETPDSQQKCKFYCISVNFAFLIFAISFLRKQVTSLKLARYTGPGVPKWPPVASKFLLLSIKDE